MRRLAIPCLLLLAGGCGNGSGDPAGDSEGPVQVSESLTISSAKRVHPTSSAVGSASTSAKGLASVGDNANGITYHGGPVMSGRVTLYYIWYGNWPATDTSKTILRDLADSMISSWEYINVSYEDTTHSATYQVVRGAETTDNSFGTSLTDANIQTLVVNAVNSGRLPLDLNGIYMVMTASGVVQGTFGQDAAHSGYCGWHTSGTNLGLKYGFVGNPMGLATPQNCLPSSNRASSPNGNVGADAMASVLMHEISETITDPEANGWVNISGNVYTENADMCAWTFGPLGASANGAKTNIHLGTRDYLIQQNWINAIGGFCGMSHPAHAVFRYFKASTGDHFYTNRWSDLGTGGSGYVYEGVMGRFYGTNREPGMIPMYRTYSPSNGQHFYTSSQTEATNAGYQIESIIGYMYASGRPSTLPVYRYFHPSNGAHFYSTNTSELGQGGNGWTFEGVVGYVSPP